MMNGYGFFIGSLRKDNVNVDKVTFVGGHSFRKYAETFINVEIEFVRVTSPREKIQTSRVVQIGVRRFLFQVGVEN
jgi:hypothetical protein